MSRTLMTSYGEYDAAVDLILSRAERQLDIFDYDLSLLKLELPNRNAALSRLLSMQNHQIRIVVIDAPSVVARHPRLLALIERHGHRIQLIEADPKLRELTDSIVIADDAHALIRFHKSLPRSKILEDESDEVRPYQRRFAEILDEGGTPISPRVAGL